jgi:hypothetical protein
MNANRTIFFVAIATLDAIVLAVSTATTVRDEHMHNLN